MILEGYWQQPEETARCLDNGVRLSVIGRRDRLSRDLVRTIENTERITHDGKKLHLRLAVDYSARAAIAWVLFLLIAVVSVVNVWLITRIRSAR